MLKERYQKEIVPRLMEALGYENIMQVPRVEKVVINMGLGDHDNPKIIEGCAADLARITGQRPVITRAKHSISDFGIVMVT